MSEIRVDVPVIARRCTSIVLRVAVSVDPISIQTGRVWAIGCPLPFRIHRWSTLAPNLPNHIHRRKWWMKKSPKWTRLCVVSHSLTFHIENHSLTSHDLNISIRKIRDDIYQGYHHCATFDPAAPEWESLTTHFLKCTTKVEMGWFSRRRCSYHTRNHGGWREAVTCICYLPNGVCHANEPRKKMRGSRYHSPVAQFDRFVPFFQLIDSRPYRLFSISYYEKFSFLLRMTFEYSMPKSVLLPINT